MTATSIEFYSDLRYVSFIFYFLIEVQFPTEQFQIKIRFVIITAFLFGKKFCFINFNFTLNITNFAAEEQEMILIWHLSCQSSFCID